MNDTDEQLAMALLDAGADAIIGTDRAGIIRFWNRGAARIFGFTQAEAIGQSLDIIIPEKLRARHWHGYREVMKTGESRYAHGDLLSVPALRKGGTRISVEFTIVPLRDAEGQMDGMAAILRDVSQRFEEMRTLRQKLAAAARSAGTREGAASPVDGRDGSVHPGRADPTNQTWTSRLPT
jgi:PAS domain S-box-containing protein